MDRVKGLEDFENPLDPVNHLHYLIKRFLYAHSGFEQSEIQGYLNLYAFVLNPPSDKLEKVEKLLNFVFENRFVIVTCIAKIGALRKNKPTLCK